MTDQLDLDGLPDLVFFPTDWNTIYDRLVSGYDAVAAIPLPENSVARTVITDFALNEQLIRVDGNEAGKQNTLAFAAGENLDHIASLKEITRLSPSFAVCTIQFVFSSPMVSAYTIPAGRRIQDSSATYIFTTDNPISLEIGDTTGSSTATCTTSGSGANDIAAGNVNTLLDDLLIDPESVSNTDATDGGGTEESDDALRTRVRLASTLPSTAGSKDSYDYWARTASTDIADVAVYSDTPGTVTVVVILTGGDIPNPALLASVLAVLDDEEVRPLTDTVEVIAPTEVTFNVDVEFDYYKSYSELTGTILDDFESQLTDWANLKKEKLGRDLVPDEVIKIGMNIPGVYSVTVNSPTYQTLGPAEVAKVGTITVAVGDEQDG
jgi:phage-related baseplate assembly protein